jgi:sugar phosphate isomerase/epimerase
MQLAIQEAILPGRSPLERFETACALGLRGIEVQAEGLTARVPALVEAMQQTGLRVAAVHMGRRDGYIAPELAEREAAIDALRQACADAVDLGADHVILVPHYGPSRMPDLRPYQSPIELEAQMFIRLLRSVSDLAYALEIELDTLPVCQQDSNFLNRLDQAVMFREKINASQYIKIAVNLYHMAVEERDWLAALQQHRAHIGYIQLAEQNQRLPGQGNLDYPALAASLQGYAGWLCLSAAQSAARSDIEASLDYLQQAGFTQ